MTDLPTKARESAIQFEAKKDGLTQRQDGSWALRLKVHPLEMSRLISNHAMGQRYVVAMVPVDDNEEPISRDVSE
jgi:hypothetical protein